MLHSNNQLEIAKFRPRSDNAGPQYLVWYYIDKPTYAYRPSHVPYWVPASRVRIDLIYRWTELQKARRVVKAYDRAVRRAQDAARARVLRAPLCAVCRLEVDHCVDAVVLNCCDSALCATCSGFHRRDKARGVEAEGCSWCN